MFGHWYLLSFLFMHTHCSRIAFFNLHLPKRKFFRLFHRFRSILGNGSNRNIENEIEFFFFSRWSFDFGFFFLLHSEMKRKEREKKLGQVERISDKKNLMCWMHRSHSLHFARLKIKTYSALTLIAHCGILSAHRKNAERNQQKSV